MVKEAPVFEDIAKPLLKILSQGVFTAHNARFDYGFIQEEFRRIGVYFEEPQCCTLKLARQLYSDLPSRSLGVLCDHLMIDIVDRHRAAGDAEATVYVLKDLLRKAQDQHDVNTWADLDGYLFCGNLHLPKDLTYKKVAALPNKPGSYIFKDEKGVIIHRGSTKDIQRRVKTFFKPTNQSEKSNKFRQLGRSIEVAQLN